MKPAPFEYHAPESLADALGLVSRQDGHEVKVLAGGQSLLALMNLRLSRPDVLVDVGGLSELGGIHVSEESVTIGAGVTHTQVERSPELFAAIPLLPYASRHIAHPPIRNRGTVGGSLAHADPAAEWPTVMSALDARLHLQSQERGSRWVPVREFFAGFLTTVLEPDEILTEIEVRLPAPNVRWAFHEAARQPGAFATVIACVVAAIGSDDAIRDMAIAVGGCGETAHTFTGADIPFAAGPLSLPVANHVADVVSSELSPLSDIHATGVDRREMARTLVGRCLSKISRNGIRSR